MCCCFVGFRSLSHSQGVERNVVKQAFNGITAFPSAGNILGEDLGRDLLELLGFFCACTACDFGSVYGNEQRFSASGYVSGHVCLRELQSNRRRFLIGISRCADPRQWKGVTLDKALNMWTSRIRSIYGIQILQNTVGETYAIVLFSQFPVIFSFMDGYIDHFVLVRYKE